MFYNGGKAYYRNVASVLQTKNINNNINLYGMRKKWFRGLEAETLVSTSSVIFVILVFQEVLTIPWTNAI